MAGALLFHDGMSNLGPGGSGKDAALWALGVSILSVIVSAATTIIFIIRLPPDAFSEYRQGWPKTLTRRILKVGMNLIGWVLILMGLALSIPGVPGQGILTIIMGLLLVDFPGRRTVLRKLLSRPVIRRTIDRLRLRFGRPPFTW